MKYLVLLFLFSFPQIAFSAEYILKLKTDSPQFFPTNFPGRVLKYHASGRLYKVELAESAASQFLQTQAAKNVEYLVPNVEIQSPKMKSSKAIPAVADQWWLQKINIEKAWALAKNRGSHKVVVAVIDSGVDNTHPDLKANVIQGFNFMTNTTDTRDTLGHGTHCAGIIGANGAVLGVSPDVSIMPLQFLDGAGHGDLFTGIVAIDYAIEKKVDVISASWGAQLSRPDYIPPFREAAERADQAGVILVAAAGNLNRDNDVVDYYPANSGTSSIISVGATDENDRKIPISNYGLKNVIMAAPGSNILSTIPNGKYKALTGTSMATPMVAGLVAFLKAQRPQLSGPEIRRILMETGAPAEIANACHCRIDAEAATRTVLSR